MTNSLRKSSHTLSVASVIICIALLVSMFMKNIASPKNTFIATATDYGSYTFDETLEHADLIFDAEYLRTEGDMSEPILVFRPVTVYKGELPDMEFLSITEFLVRPLDSKNLDGLYVEGETYLLLIGSGSYLTYDKAISSLSNGWDEYHVIVEAFVSKSESAQKNDIEDSNDVVITSPVEGLSAGPKKERY